MSARKLCNHQHLLPLLLVRLLSQPVTAMNSCDATAAVESYPSTVNCHFEEDPSIRRHTIRIVRYDLAKPTFQPELMLVCKWENSDSSPTCKTASASITNTFNGREASITFASTNQKHDGVYKCLVNGDTESKSCNLHVRKPETSCTNVTVKEGESAAITCNFNSDLSKTHDDFYVQWFPTDSPFETALSCNWQGPGNDDWICKARYPFTFNNTNITNTVTLGLKPGSLTLRGELLCNIVLYTEAEDKVKAKRCSVIAGQNPTTKLVIETTAEPSTESSISSSSTIRNDEPSYAVKISLNNRISTLALCILLLLLA